MFEKESLKEPLSIDLLRKSLINAAMDLAKKWGKYYQGAYHLETPNLTLSVSWSHILINKKDHNRTGYSHPDHSLVPCVKDEFWAKEALYEMTYYFLSREFLDSIETSVYELRALSRLINLQ